MGGVSVVKKRIDSKHIAVGAISGLHGVQGWLKVFSDAQPRENIFSYSSWYLYTEDGMKSVEVSAWREQGKTLVAKLVGINDRESARSLIGATIAIDQVQLPVLEKGSFYWRDLIGLRLKTVHTAGTRTPDKNIDLGVVKSLIETGSNDVLVVKGDEKSLDNQERLVPWIPDQFVLSVDLMEGVVLVDWDPDF